VLSEQCDGGEDAAAYLGITVKNFPNFFCLYGPGTNLAHGGSLIFHSECEMRYISGCLGALVAGGHRSLEVRADVHDAYEAKHQAEINQMVWASPTIRHVILECPAVNAIDTSALESLEAINHRLKDGGITFHLSEVKGPVMDRLKRSHFLEELTGKVHLSQYEAVASINPELARRTLAAERVQATAS